MKRLDCPRVVAILPRVIPSTTITVLKPLTALHRAGRLRARFRLEYWVSPTDVADADLIVFCRNRESAYSRALDWARAAGKPIIYDLDDNLFALPAASGDETESERTRRAAQLTRYLQSAHLVRVYSEYLRKRIAEINPRVVRVDGPLDWSLVPAERPKKTGQEPISIVYTTSRIGDELAGVLVEEVNRVLELGPARVKLVLWGNAAGGLAHHPSVRFLKPVMDYDRFFRSFARAGFDIGLAPLVEDDFHLSKSDNKFREYAACGLAGIYSNVPVYSECVEDGSTGLLVENRKGEWYQAIRRLVEDAELRTRIQQKAHAYARARYGQDRFCAVWWEQIQSLVRDKPGAEVRATPESEAFDQAGLLSREVQPPSRVDSLLSRWAGGAPRFLRSWRERGIRETMTRARWAINDWSIRSWNRACDN